MPLAKTIAGLLLFLLGCGARREYQVARLDLTRTGWDTLHVRVDFAARSVLGGEQSVTPAVSSIHVYSRSYDTLYAGGTAVIAVPDARLGDREPLMVEGCGTFGQRQVCEQQAVATSPKRIRVEHDIAYPEAGRYEHGRYDLHFVVERQRYDTDAWEQLDGDRAVRGYLLAYVAGEAGKAVKVPFQRARGRFDLARSKDYKHFAYSLRSRLLDAHEAAVRFDIYASLRAGAPAVQLASVEKLLRSKTEGDRLLEVRYFAEQAAGQVLDRLAAWEGDARAYAYLDAWSFDALHSRYVARLEIVWRDGWAARDRHALEGVLEVPEEGGEAHFRLLEANRRGRRRWQRRVDGDTLTLGPLLTVADQETKTLEETPVPGQAIGMERQERAF